MPPELAVCYLEDWVRPEEEPPAWWAGGTINADQPDGGELDWRLITASHRCGIARRAWLTEHGIAGPERARLIPIRGPRMKDAS